MKPRAASHSEAPTARPYTSPGRCPIGANLKKTSQCRLARATRECREALECGGLTPLFLAAEAAGSISQPFCAPWRASVLPVRSNDVRASIASKAKAGSSPRTPKAGAKLLNPPRTRSRCLAGRLEFTLFQCVCLPWAGIFRALDPRNPAHFPPA